MPRTRQVAVDLARKGSISILQKGVEVDLDHFKGPIRLRIRESLNKGVTTKIHDKLAVDEVANAAKQEKERSGKTKQEAAEEV
mmetsp:Transcript_18194/g.34451  ORF Transcript_18194/g.34451 Transcript_18194/m.34451 type:complete len:83 (+) Transcript_18194:314-562(+)